MPTTADALRSIPIFQGMSDRSIEIIETIAREATYRAGATLVEEGTPGDSFLVIRHGSASVEQGGRHIRDLSAGDFLGEIALIDGGPRTATVTASEDIDALVIDRDGFQRLMDDFPVIRYDLVSALTQRLRAKGADPTD
jgi:CRP/FNR family transcriptional regulator, cyclic AMP receptor protein